MARPGYFTLVVIISTMVACLSELTLASCTSEGRQFHTKNFYTYKVVSAIITFFLCTLDLNNNKLYFHGIIKLLMNHRYYQLRSKFITKQHSDHKYYKLRSRIFYVTKNNVGYFWAAHKNLDSIAAIAQFSQHKSQRTKILVLYA